MRILLACEESQAVTIEMRKLGHEAFSCDLLPCSGGHPEWHLQQDVTELLKQKYGDVAEFARFEKGEGIEKKEENFAEEVMNQLK